MAKIAAGRAASAKVKSAAPSVVASKKAGAASVATKTKQVPPKIGALKIGALKTAKAKNAPAKAADSHTAAPKAAAAKVKALGHGAGKAAPKQTAATRKATSATRSAASPKKVAAVRTSAPAQPPTQRSATAKSAPAKPATARLGTAKSTPPAKTVAVKQAAPRRSAVRTAVPVPVARRARSAAPPRQAPAAVEGKPTTATPQVFTVSHLNEADFKTDGLRHYAQYRDLGIAGATGGLCQAHVIRFTPPCTDEVRKPHLHQVDLQLIYVLKGWMKNAFEGHGEQMMSTGSCWLQPAGIRHTVLDYSPDCEVLEIIVPADFKTEELT